MATLRNWNAQIGTTIGHVTETQLPVSLPVREWDYSAPSGPRAQRPPTTGIVAEPHGYTGVNPIDAWNFGRAPKPLNLKLRPRLGGGASEGNAEDGGGGPFRPVGPNNYGPPDGQGAPMLLTIPRRQLPGQGTPSAAFAPIALPPGPAAPAYSGARSSFGTADTSPARRRRLIDLPASAVKETP